MASIIRYLLAYKEMPVAGRSPQNGPTCCPAIYGKTRRCEHTEHRRALSRLHLVMQSDVLFILPQSLNSRQNSSRPNALAVWPPRQAQISSRRLAHSIQLCGVLVRVLVREKTQGANPTRSRLYINGLLSSSRFSPPASACKPASLSTQLPSRYLCYQS